MAGENENYLVTSNDNQRFVLKVAGGREDYLLIELENDAVNAVAASCNDL